MINLRMTGHGDAMDYFYCDKCGARTDRDLSYRIEGKLVCSSCANDIQKDAEQYVRNAGKLMEEMKCN
jgi:formylmethanofuran dehydrogenase subunit E